ncbi:MAG: hypothetical protein ISP90_17495 [Nevskia sp.]|nr:hypothetical protein [Nevskia sp.]
MIAECAQAAAPAAPELEALRYIAAGRDPFTGCAACGDYGRRLQLLAALRRAALIDHSDRLTAAGRAMLEAFVA